MAVGNGDVRAEKLEAGSLIAIPRSDVDIQNEHGHRWMKLVSLLLLTPQYAVLILLMRYVRTRPGVPMFVTSTTVLMAEVFKTLTCLVIIFVQQGGPKGFCSHMHEFLICRPWDFMKVCVPSMLFVIQNNLVFVAVSNLDAATFQVTYQLKILTTAIFSVVLLGKRLSGSQWLALLMLFAGVSIIQVKQGMQLAASAAAATSKPTPDDLPSSAVMTRRSALTVEQQQQHSPASLETHQQAHQQNPFTGLMAVLACCILSGFANVFFEVLLKGGKQSVWMRNVQLGLSGTVLGALACMAHDGGKISQDGFFMGYDSLVWGVVTLQSFGGLLVAAVIKYADNILKGFATAGSILLSCVASVYIFNFQMDQIFILGTFLVMMAVYVYSSYPPVQPDMELNIKEPSEKKSTGK